jgi:site-specific recombinase XerD
LLGVASQAVYTCIIRKYGKETNIIASMNGLCVHSLRSKAATHALEHGADIANTLNVNLLNNEILSQGTLAPDTCKNGFCQYHR